MRIALIGHTGFLGSIVYEYLLTTKYIVDGYNSSTDPIQCNYDIIINCAGTSRMYLTERDPKYSKSIEDKLFKKLQQINCSNIIHISSICTELSNNYGKIKLLTETRIKKQFSNWIILRPTTIIGKQLKKNIVFDILNDNQIYITKDSTFNFVSANAIVKLLLILIENPCYGETINVGGSKDIVVNNIPKIFQKKNVIWGTNYLNFSSINIEKANKILKLKTSEEYLKEYLKEYNFMIDKL